MWYKEFMLNNRLSSCLLRVVTASMVLASTAAPARAENGLDREVTRFVNLKLANGFFDDTMKGASETFLPVLAPIGFAIGLGDRGRKAAILMSVAGILAFGDSELLKLAIHRDRPYVVEPDLRIKWKLDTGSSFPSSHTTVAFAVATIIADQYPLDWVEALSYGMASVVGFSRIYLGQHYLTDVIAGAALGYGTAKGVLWLRDVIGLHDQFSPAPQVGWTSNGTPTIGLSWSFGASQAQHREFSGWVTAAQ